MDSSSSAQPGVACEDFGPYTEDFVLPVTFAPQCGICKQEAVSHIARISVGGAGGLNCVSMVGPSCLRKYLAVPCRRIRVLGLR